MSSSRQVPAPFRLSSSLFGHQSDVRCLASTPDESSPVLFSSSRDGTAKSWYRLQNGEELSTSHTGKGGEWVQGHSLEDEHEGFVNAVEWIAGPQGGFVATGGQDRMIRIWPLPSSTTNRSSSQKSKILPSHTLIGHENNVCALHASKDGHTLVSGSWDKTAIVWKDFQIKHRLKGHEQSVWAVLALEDDEDLILTGAADNLIKLWKGSKVARTFTGHSQAVRALAKLDAGVGGGDLFASAGNDGSIRLWSLKTGDPVHVLSGHDSFVYSLSAIPDSAGGGLISGGEDRTVRVWRAADGECEQTIVVPAISVWSVNALANGDIAAGTSDGVIRIFTRSQARTTDEKALEEYNREVSNTALNSSQIGDVKKSDLPGMDVLLQPGNKEGQVVMVKADNGSVEAHQWSSAAREWVKIGEVVDAVGSGRKKVYEGKEFDYVFDVDIKEGAPPLKLPYNVTENPYAAAQRFLFANELPTTYIDEVVAFIEKNTGGVNLGSGHNNEAVDPYTGSSRYTGGGVGSASAAGTNAYIGGGDPYTGGGKSATSGSPAAAKLLPHTVYFSFSQANLPALQAKLMQLNEQMAKDTATSSFVLSALETSSLNSLIASLLISQAGTSKSKSLVLDEAQRQVALKLLRWPPAAKFPGIDLIRMIALSSPFQEAIPALLEIVQESTSSSGSSKDQEVNMRLTFRTLANMFKTLESRSAMKDEALEVLDCIKRRSMTGINSTGKIALSTVLLNYSISAVENELDGSVIPLLLELLVDLLKDTDSEVIYRSLVALGNILLSPDTSSLVPAAGLQRYKNLAKDAARRLPEPRNKQIIAEIS